MFKRIELGLQKMRTIERAVADFNEIRMQSNSFHENCYCFFKLSLQKND